MKNLLIATAILSLSTLAQASTVNLVNGDGSELSQMCIAAVEGGVEINSVMGRQALCNDMPMERFVNSMRKEIASRETTYVLSAQSENELAGLCIAAVESDEALKSVKIAMFGRNLHIDDKISCNGMSLKSFARKYRNLVTTSSL